MTDLILQDDRHCTLTCVKCTAKLELDWKVWTHPEKKLTEIQQFRALHQDCKNQIDAENRLKFWGKPGPGARKATIQ